MKYLILFAFMFCGCSSPIFYTNTDFKFEYSQTEHIQENRNDNISVNSENSSILPVRQEYEGDATYYGAAFHGRTTASGETYNMYALTAANRTLPFGTLVTVTNIKNGKAVTVRINDRGPVDENIIIDLSYEAARRIDLLSRGKVKMEVH